MDSQAPFLTRGGALRLSALFGVVMIALALLIDVGWRGRAPTAMFQSDVSLAAQLGVATAAAVFVAAVVVAVTLRWSALEPFRQLVRSLMGRAVLQPLDMAIIAAVAGVSEEMLFRGAVQPALGVWWTSLIFMMAHGIVLPTTWRRALFGATVFSLSVGLGYLARHVGLSSAIAAHATYDFLVLFAMDRALVKKANEAD